MALTKEQLELLRQKLKSFAKNPTLMEEFGINHPSQIEHLSSQEIEKHLNTRILSIIGLSKKDLGML